MDCKEPTLSRTPQHLHDSQLLFSIYKRRASPFTTNFKSSQVAHYPWWLSLELLPDTSVFIICLTLPINLKVSFKIGQEARSVAKVEGAWPHPIDDLVRMVNRTPFCTCYNLNAHKGLHSPILLNLVNIVHIAFTQLS